MIEGVPGELATMGISALGGYFMKLQAEARKERHAEHMRALERHNSSEQSRDRAATNPGKWIRRGLVASIIFAVIVAPFIVAVFTDAETVVQFTEQKKTWLFGKPRDFTRFEVIKGYLLTPETRHSLLAIIAFYFGQGAAK